MTWQQDMFTAADIDVDEDALCICTMSEPFNPDCPIHGQDDDDPSEEGME